jgi:2'-5' RNA ligase
MRVFFAVWPDESSLERLVDAESRLFMACGGKRTRRESIHLTLAFVGEIREDDLGRLKDAACRVSASAFEIVLDKLGHWKHNKIAWAGCAQVQKPLLELVSMLESELKSSDIALDARPYVPHVTLLRKAEHPETIPDIPAISWAVSEFTLTASTPSGYENLASWPLKVDA